MTAIKILIAFGTRPEIIKLAPLIIALKGSPLKDQVIVVSTSQHDSLLNEQLDCWNIVPDYFLTSSPHKGNLTRLLTHTLSGLQDVVEQVATIEYIIVQGDTNTALTCANLAFLNQIKLIHIEAGLRSFDFTNPFPEEFNRIVTSRAAYFHFAPTENSKNNLLNEGVDSSKIIVIGNTVIDALYSLKEKNTNTSEKNTVIITLHRRENIDYNYLILTDLISSLALQHPHLNFLWITHPNCADKIKSQIPELANIAIQEHLPYKEFLELYDSARMIITDSGGVSEEAIHLGLPLLIFRQATERIEAINYQYPMIVSIDKNDLLHFFNEHINKTNTIKYSYGDGNASKKVVDWLMSEMNQVVYDLIIIGGGPAGTGLLLKALKEGASNKLFDKKIAVIEKNSGLIKGNITGFKVNSDTISDVFLECLEGDTGNFIDLTKLKDEIEFIKTFKGRSIPLEMLDDFYHKLGILLKEALESTEKCDFILNSIVEKVIQKDDNIYEVYIEGKKNAIRTGKIIIATGGVPQSISDKSAFFADAISLKTHLSKCIHSDTILKAGLPDHLKSQLRKNPKIVILGGSHSALSVAYSLLNSPDVGNLIEEPIKIWCTSLPKIYFNTKEEAIANSYSDFTDADICPVTKKLYRLAGLRMDGKELFMHMLGLGNLKKETRVKLQVFKNQTSELEEDLNNAAVIVLAYGYKFNMFPFIDKHGKEIKFKGEYTNHWVNDMCELLDENGKVISGVYASGLATGFIPNGELGGEPSFQGQTNGIWYYQNAIADRIINSINSEHTSNLS